MLVLNTHVARKLCSLLFALLIAERILRQYVTDKRADTLVNARRMLKKDPRNPQLRLRYTAIKRDVGKDIKKAKAAILHNVEQKEKRNIKDHGFIHNSAKKQNEEILKLQSHLKCLDHYLY